MVSEIPSRGVTANCSKLTGMTVTMPLSQNNWPAVNFERLAGQFHRGCLCEVTDRGATSKVTSCTVESSDWLNLVENPAMCGNFPTTEFCANTVRVEYFASLKSRMKIYFKQSEERKSHEVRIRISPFMYPTVLIFRCYQYPCLPIFQRLGWPLQ